MSDKRAENVVVVERPVCDSVVVFLFGCTQDTLIVVSKFNEIYSVPLSVVSVDLLGFFDIVVVDGVVV